MIPQTSVLLPDVFGEPEHQTTLTLPAGLSLQQIVGLAVPNHETIPSGHLRVTLANDKGEWLISQMYWSQLRPKVDVKVIIRIVPGKSTLRAVLLAVVSIAAISLGGFTAGLLFKAGTLGFNVAKIAFSAVFNVVGNLLVNALVPLPNESPDKPRNSYAIAGWQNQVLRDEPIPFVLGKHRYAPPFAAASYTEIVGDDQYIRAMFTFGYGPLKLSDFKLGETSIDEFDEVEMEVREGRADDLPMALYPRQVLEDSESGGIELLRPLPRDDAGDVVAGPSIETPIKRFTARHTHTVSVIIGFPSGLFRVDDKGRFTLGWVDVRIRMRAEGVVPWSDVETLKVFSLKREAFFRTHTWELPSRGRYEIEITRMTDESTNSQVADRVVLAALQSIRPEYPLNFEKPLSLVSMRIKATHQLNGALSNFNAMVERYGQVWEAEAETWSEGLSRNPASAYLAALQGPANPFPVPDAQVDLDQISDWYSFCVQKGLKYDRVHQPAETFRDMLLAICASGRATPRHDGVVWGVAVDRPDLPVVDEISPRNSSDFSWDKTYFDPPDGFRVTFFDETNDYEHAERIVPWPGHVGSIDLTEGLQLLGKTDPDEIWIEARRRMYELQYRSNHYTVTQSGAARVATRGSLVMLNTDVLERTQMAARVKSVRDNLIELDDTVTFDEGEQYGLRFRVFSDPDDGVGEAVVREVLGTPGETRLLRMNGLGEMPVVGHVVHFGLLGNESSAVKVRGIEGGSGFSSILNLVPSAPEIDTLTDAEVPPVWNGLVGNAASFAGTPVPVPRISRVLHGSSGTGDPDRIELLFQPGLGSGSVISTYRVEHKLSVDPTFTTTSVPAANGGVALTSYEAGETVDIRLIALLADATESDPSPTITLTVGSADALIPGALSNEAIVVVGGLGGAALSIGLTSDVATEAVQIYRTASGVTLNPATDAVGAPIASAPNTTITYQDGDGTRTNLALNGTFADASVWSAPGNWSIIGGTASHTASAGFEYLSQSTSVPPASGLRVEFTIANYSAGSVRFRLRGDTDVFSGYAYPDGTYNFILTAPDNLSDFGIYGSTFVGDVDDVTIFVTTPACLDQGSYDYYFEPQNEDGVAGPISGPFTVAIK